MKRRGVMAVAVAIALVLVPAGAGAHDQPEAVTAPGVAVSIGFVDYAPRRVDVLVGEPVTWTNESVRTHTVTADDGSFDSGPLAGSARSTRAFAAEGDVAYHCELHAGMVGTVGVHRVLLDAPRQAAGPGRAFPLNGRAALPAGTDVSIEADTGTGFAPVARTVVGADGSFAADVIPRTSGQLHAVAAGAVSPAVALTVLDHHVTLSARSVPGRVDLRAAVTPAAPGATLVLQLLLPERFGWWPVRTVRLGRSSLAAFSLPLHRRVPARFVLTLPDGATPLATSAVRRIGRRSGRAP